MNVRDLIQNLPQGYILYVYNLEKTYQGTQLEDFVEILDYPVNVVGGLVYGYISESSKIC